MHATILLSRNSVDGNNTIVQIMKRLLEKNTMVNKIYLGNFNAEALWADDVHVKLPEITDANIAKIILSMDELLFPICTSNDILLTRYAIQKCQKQYLDSIAYNVVSNTESIDKDYSTKSTLISLLLSQISFERFKSYFSKDRHLSPYAHIPDMDQLCNSYNITYNGPAIDVVKKVNSKIYSHEIHGSLGLKSHSIKVTTIAEMENAASYFNNRQFIIKYPFGVSGKGNVLITSERMFKRILKHCSQQVTEGKQLELLVEPFLDKILDFSCHMNIESDGKATILSLQKMDNNKFAYLGSSCASSEMYADLEEKGYFSLMRSVAQRLYSDGYFGKVCVDSMMLKDQTIVPIVEINARKSMGLINHYINTYLGKYNLNSYLRYYSLGIKKTFCYETLLNNMELENLLFKTDEKPGILPLSSNAMTVNRDADVDNEDKTINYMGRLYVSIGAHDMRTKIDLSQRFNALLANMGVTIYN
jgi:hypothetical protein